MTRPVLPIAALVAALSLVVSLGACGSARQSTTEALMGQTGTTSVSSGVRGGKRSASSRLEQVQQYSATDKDRDNDPESEPYDDANHERSYAEYGPKAGAAQTRAVGEVVKRYYALAVDRRAAQACAMIDAPLAASAGEDYGGGGERYLEGAQTCGEVVSRTFAHFHKQLVGAVGELKILQVRVRDDHALAVLGFGGVERQILLSHEKGKWTIAQLLDSEVT